MYGQKTNVGIARQESWGTPNVTSLFWLPFISESLGIDRDPLISQANRGIFDEGDHYPGPSSISGDVSIETQPQSFGAMVAAFFGVPQTSVKADSADVYTHTFKLPQTDFDKNCAKTPYTIVKNFDVSSAIRMSDMNANRFELSVANGEFLTAALGFVGGHFQEIGGLVPAFTTGKRFTWDASSIRDASSGGTDLELSLTDLSVVVTENIEAQHTLVSSTWPNRIKRTGFRTLEVSGTMKFESMEIYQQFLTDEQRGFTIGFHGPVEISSGYYDSIAVAIHSHKFMDFKPVAGGPGQIEVSFSGKGPYSPGAGAMLTVTLINTQVSY